jgi:hypothetical protein
MARAPIGRNLCVTGIKDRANDNEILVSPITYGHQSLSDELIEAGLVTDEEMVIIRDPISGDWLVEDYAREAVLFHMPSECSLNDVRRAIALYVTAFTSGFEQGRFVARSTNILR